MERPLYYVTALSNFARGYDNYACSYDNYACSYDKARIPESAHKERFFLLARHEPAIGLARAAHLPQKTGLAGDRLIVLETHAASDELQPNLRTGLGRFVPRLFLKVLGVERHEDRIDWRIDEVLASAQARGASRAFITGGG